MENNGFKIRIVYFEKFEKLLAHLFKLKNWIINLFERIKYAW